MHRARRLLIALTLLGATLASGPAHAAVTVDGKNPSGCFNESDSPEKKLIFRVVLSEAPTETVTVDYETVEGSARSGEDFVGAEGTLTFLAGDRRETIRVPIVDDERNERKSERFFVSLSNAGGASIGHGTIAGWICDDDARPMVDVGDVSVGESVMEAKLPVRLTERSGRWVRLSYDAGMNGSPDYTATSGTLVWPPGATMRRIEVPINPDWIDEHDETFEVHLFGGKNVGSVEQDTWQFDVEIADDDPLPAVAVDDVSINESDAVLGTPIPIPLTWIGETEKQVVVYFRLVPLYGDGDPKQEHDATEGFDYETNADGLLLFGMNATVSLIHDGDNEFNESFKIELYDAEHVLVNDAAAIVTIVDDDF